MGSRLKTRFPWEVSRRLVAEQTGGKIGSMSGILKWKLTRINKGAIKLIHHPKKNPRIPLKKFARKSRNWKKKINFSAIQLIRI